MAEPPLLRIHTDGASRGNPGAAAFAYVIARDGVPPIEEAGCLGDRTNNQAEYTALVRALEHALKLGPEHAILLHSDSELLVKQMNGEYRVKSEELRGLYEQAQALRSRFRGPVTFRHVRRDQNSRADALCNQALDGLFKPTPQAAPAPPLSEQARDCLRQAAAAWSRGATELTPEIVWQQLVELLAQHGIRVP